MQVVSNDFLRSIVTGSKVTYTCTVTTAGVSTPLALTAGTVSVQSGSNTRRTLDATVGSIDTGNLSVGAIYDLLSAEDAVIRVTAGFDWGSTASELIPVFTGRPSQASLKISEGTVSLSAADYGYDLAQMSWMVSLVQDAALGRRDAIKAIVTAANFTINDLSTDTGTLGTSQTWTGSFWDAISQIATDAGIDCFFTPDGVFTMRDTPTITADSAYLYLTGDQGNIETFDRQRTLDELYNAVKVTPATTGQTGWTDQYIIQTITDANSPRLPSKIGLRVKDITSFTGTQADAINTARTTLANLQGSTETLSIASIANPALEVGDVIQILAQDRDGNTFLTHMIDSYSFDISSWSMTVNTRSRNA